MIGARCAVLAMLLTIAAACANPASEAVVTVAEPAAWTGSEVCYEIFVRSFQDSDGDGVGDLNGLISRLDYINDGDPGTDTDLGARCIWLMPIAESPSYHGYDVTDYYEVDREYGTKGDFARLMDEAHRRGIRVLVDMVINHSSSEHPHFQSALHDTRSPYRDWYRWSAEKPAELNEWGHSNWHRSPVRDEYYYGFFWEGMPDFNYDAPGALDEMKRVATFWLDEMGVDGFRMDAIIHLVEEGSKDRHLAGTHEVLREYGEHVRRVAPDAFTVGEAWGTTEEMLAYYPDQLDAYFAFEVADSIISTIRSGRARGLLPPIVTLQDAVPDQRWATFLRNHDQTRTATELGGHPARLRLAAAILLTFPGTPFLYYGEEIGMTGDKPDPRLRTPMQWEAVAGAGFTSGTPWAEMQPDSFQVTVASQEGDSSSLLRHYRELIRLRGAHEALGRGRLIALESDAETVAAYLRQTDEETVLVVVNLGGSPVTDATMRLPAGALAAGEYDLEPLMGGPMDRLAVEAATASYRPGRLQPFDIRIARLDRR